MKSDPLYALAQANLLSDLDRHFSALMGRLSDAPNPTVNLAAALAVQTRRMGHVCLDLPAIAGRPPEAASKAPPLPDLDAWRAALVGSGVVGRPGDFMPLILDKADRLYLHRYWAYQDRLARGLLSRGQRKEEAGQGEKELSDLLDRYFPPMAGADGPDLQRRAAAVALTRRLCVISGGPGTGKTTTVAKILALSIEAADDPPAAALAAPTGKAAARMTAALVRETADPQYDPIREWLPDGGATIHRLLGSIPDSPYFRHNSDNPLPADLVVIDEASMVDMALMAKLMDALKPEARLILLGDRDQLASVEAGAVLGDICDTGGTSARTEDADGIGGCIVQLERSYRFGPDSGIGAVSRAVNTGDADAAIALLRDGARSDATWMDPFLPDAPPPPFREAVVNGYRDYLEAGLDPEAVLQRFDRFRVLCGLRRGPFGAMSITEAVESILARAGHIRPAGTWYHGRPVMITRNDYALRLFNGDVGVALRDPGAAGEIRVFFPGSDGGVRRLHPLRLPDHETVFAMTVHKSQGSEFDRVALLLPDRDAPVLTRELIYTGLTRAREAVAVWGDPAVFRRAVERRIRRSSGLRDALWGGGR